MKKEMGNVGDYLATGICMLFLTILVVSFLNHVSLIESKQEINQIARKYILKMETVGGIDESDKTELLQELQKAGATEISLEGSSEGGSGYGETIVLQVRGRLKGGYEFCEKRVSTAKY